MSGIDSSDNQHLANIERINESFSIGTWHLCMLTDKLDWSAITKRIHDVDSEYQPQLDTALNFYSDHEPGKHAITEALKKGIAEGCPWDLECRLVTAKGRQVWVRAIGRAIRDDTGKTVALEGAIQDITTIKLDKEKASTAQLELEHQIYALNHHAIVSIGDLTGNILYANDKFCSISGYSAEELQDNNHRLVNSTIHDRAFWQTFWSTISSGQVFRGEICNRSKNGELYWVDSTVVPHVDESGNIDRYIAIRTDITAKKMAEEKSLELQKSVNLMQKMETLGKFVGGIAHDFNNILAVTIGYAQLLRLDIDAGQNETAKFNIQQVESSGHRAKDLVKKLLAFTRGSTEDSSRFSVSDYVGHFFLETIRPMVPSSIDIHIKTSDSPLNIHFNKSSMSQILMNLCVNSRDALTSGGTIRIEAEPIEINSGRCASCFQEFSGNFAKIRVQDDGNGIAQEIITKIFDPFFSTKDAASGSGMGLSVTHGLVHGSGGHILLNSSPKNTCVDILIPLDDSEPTLILDETLFDNESARSLTFAIVDDEEAIGQMLKAMLQQNGVKVMLYSDSRTLLEDIQSGQITCDLLLSDLTMPHVGGRELCEASRLQAGIGGVVAMSGYSEDINENNYQAHGFDAYLSKPLNLSDIKALIAQTLIDKDATP